MNGLKYFLALDIAGDCPIGDFFAGLQKHNVALHNVIPIGPGGGNPCITIASSETKNIEEYLKGEFLADTDELKFKMSRLQELSFA